MSKVKQIRCEALRSVGVPDTSAAGGVRMVHEGERFTCSLELARRWQDAGAVKIVLSEEGDDLL